jgi:hypothetical protein
MHRPVAAFMIIALALLGLAGWPANTIAQTQSPFTLDVHAGYDGGYRMGEWFVVEVNIANDGPDVGATLEWSFPGQPEEQTFQRTIELPRGARKRISLDVFASGFARNGLVRLLDGSNELVRQDVSLESFDESVFLIGVVSSDPALLNSLEAQQVAGFSTTRVRHIAVSGLPELSAELRGLNALFLHDTDTAALGPAQREAISLWAGQGGQLVISGGVNAQKVASGLADLLPVQAIGALAQGDLAPLVRLANINAPPPNANIAISQAQPRPGAEQVPSGTGLIYRWRYGSGMVIFSAFDFSSLRGWDGEGALWSELLPRQPTLLPGAGATLHQFNLLDRGVLDLPALNLPSTWTILLFLLIYILIIGPLNYVLLRRIGRLELAWLTVPLIVLSFAAGLYLVGWVVRGGQPQFNQVAVVQGVEGQSRGAATSFVGLFSPSRASYTLSFPAATLVSSGSSRSFLISRFDTVVADEAGARTLDVLADVASVTTIVAEAAIDLPLNIQSSLAFDGLGVTGEIRNTGTTTLEDVTIVRGEMFAQLGTLAPGASQQIASGGMRPNFPNSLALANSTVFNRQSMVNLLFDRDALRLRNPGLPSSGSNSAEGVYLLAWIKQPSISIGVNGQTAAQNGLTLYVIRLQASTRG